MVINIIFVPFESANSIRFKTFCSVWVSCAQQGIMYWVSWARDVLGMRRKGIKTIVVTELNL